MRRVRCGPWLDGAGEPVGAATRAGRPSWVLGLMLGLLGPIAVSAQTQPVECNAAQAQAGRLLAMGEGFRVLFVARPEAIRVGDHFALEITVCPRPGTAGPALLKVDADMPAHRHGMNYRATLQPHGEGRFQAQGLMFHMPGRWRFIFDVSDDRGSARLTREIEVE